LTEIAHWIVGRRQLALPSPGMASSRLGDRVERLLDDRVSRVPEPPRAWLPPTALGTLGLVIFAVPGVSSAGVVRPAATENAPADETPAERRFDFRSLAPPATEPVLPASPSALGIRTDQQLLDDELQLLQAELDQLREELDESALYDRFEHAFETITRRMDDLRSRKERLNALLARVLSESETPDNDDETP